MLPPERGTPDRETAEERIYRKIMNMTANVAVRKKLPSVVHVLTLDEATSAKIAAFIRIKYVGESGAANIDLISAGILPPEETVEQAVDILLSSNPGMPMICDKKIADELGRSSLVWVEEDHYRLEGRPRGVLEVYTPYGTITSPEVARQIGANAVQIYTE